MGKVSKETKREQRYNANLHNLFVKAQEEIEEAKPALKKYKARVIDIIQYDLPLEENHTRNLVVIAIN